MTSQPKLRFATIGVNHAHIYGQTQFMLGADCELAAVYGKEPELVAQYQKSFPQARAAADPREILEDPSISLILSAAIPADRGPIGIQAMRHGKDFMSDKGGPTSLEQLAEIRKVQAETGRIYSICFSERFEVPAAVKAGQLVHSGAIGKVVQTIGFGPHRVGLHNRPAWFFEKKSYGGILTDIASHQMDQFLYFTGSTSAEVVSSQVANYKHPQYPEFEDFGDVTLRGNGGTGYVRVDWFTPDGLSTWGDGRMFILGTDGYIELRKYIDIEGRPGKNHLFWVNHEGMHYIDCNDVELTYGKDLANDILNRTETAMPQAHCFLAVELALKAEAAAARLGNLA